MYRLHKMMPLGWTFLVPDRDKTSRLIERNSIQRGKQVQAPECVLQRQCLDAQQQLFADAFSAVVRVDEDGIDFTGLQVEDRIAPQLATLFGDQRALAGNQPEVRLWRGRHGGKVFSENRRQLSLN